MLSDGQRVNNLCSFRKMMKIKLFILLLTLSNIADASCKYRGKKICEGAVTKEYKTIVQLCENGRLRYKKRSKVKPGYPRAGKGNKID